MVIRGNLSEYFEVREDDGMIVGGQDGTPPQYRTVVMSLPPSEHLEFNIHIQRSAQAIGLLSLLSPLEETAEFGSKPLAAE